jgi:hypothetical protein
MANANTFARLGYNNAGAFTPVNTRAQDVIASDGTSAETHITNAVIHLTTEQIALITNAIQASQKGAANGVASLGADGKVPASQLAISGFEVTQTVDDYATLLGLSVQDAPLTSLVLVEDASGDSTVESGWAVYFRTGTDGTASDWLKFAEGEGLDISFTEIEADILAAQQTADNAATAAGTAQAAAQTAQSAAEAAQSTANTAAANALLLDAAYCTDETDMATKNLRVGAFVLMQVTNDEPTGD